MASVHVYPDKLPCDMGGSFVVVLSEALPSNVSEYSLIFEGVKSRNRISGKAVRVDTKTLIGTVGEYSQAEDVNVEVVATSGGAQVPPFTMTFLSRFQLICSFFPDDILLQAPVAVARCLPTDRKDMNAVDEELAEFCQRNMPLDLSFRHFFGSDLDEKMGSQGTLLHFAAECGLTRFAAHLLAASGGAWEALQTVNKAGLTPAKIAKQQQHADMEQLFADYEDVAAHNAVPLVEYSNLQELMGSDYLRVEPKRKPQGPKDVKRKKKSLLASIVSERKSAKDKKKKGKDERGKQKSIFRHLDLQHIKKNLSKVGRAGAAAMSTIRKIGSKDSDLHETNNGTMERSASRDSLRHPVKRGLPPIPQTQPLRKDEEYCDMDDDGDDDDDDDDEYETIEIPKTPKKTVHRPMGAAMRPNSNYMRKIVARAVSLIDYRPGPQDPHGSLKLKKGQEINVTEISTSGAWVSATVDGVEGCVMKSALSTIDELYEVDRGVAIEMDEIPEYCEYDDTGVGHEENDQYIVLHDWMPEQAGDLRVYEGDVVTVLEKNPNQWWRVQKANDGLEGLVPSTYLQEHELQSKEKVHGSKASGGSLSSVTSSHSSGDSVPPPPHIVKPNIGLSNSPRSSARIDRNHHDATSEDSGSSQDSGIGGSSVLKLASKLGGTLKGGGGAGTLSNSTVRRTDWSEPKKPPTAAKPIAPKKAIKPPVLPPSTSSPQNVVRTKVLPPPSKGPKPSSPQIKSPLIHLKPAITPGQKGNSVGLPDPSPSSARSLESPTQKRPSTKSYLCCWDFDGSDQNDLTIKCGDVIVVAEQSNDDWWIGTCNGRTGVFPAGYVKKLE